MQLYFLNLIKSSAGIFLSRVTGLVRDIVVASVYGASGITDIFFVAFAIPNLFRQFFVEGAMSSAFMPFLAEKFKIGGSKLQNAYLTQLIIVQTFIVSIITILIMLFASYVIKLFIPGYADDEEMIKTGATLLQIIMPFLITISIGGLLSGYINLQRGYFLTYASSSLFNILMIVGAWFGYRDSGNISYLAWGCLAGGVVQTVVIYFISIIYGFKPIFISKIDKAVKETYLLLVPSLAGVSISQLNFLIGRVMASYLQLGSISWLFYSNRLFQFPLGVFSVAIGMVSLTELSKAYADNNAVRRAELIDKAIIALLLIIIPATFGLIILAEDIVRLIYLRNAFTLEDVKNTAIALQMYSAGLLFFSLINVLTRVFHAVKDTKTPVKAALLGFIVNAILNVIFMQFMGHAGIALASSIAALANALLLYYLIPSYSFQIKRYISMIVKILFANIILVALIFFLKYLNVNVLINVGLAIAIYFVTLYILRVRVLKLLR